MEQLNFNRLAWEAPEYPEGYGYKPTDKYYNEIIEWLKVGETIWITKEGTVSTKRIRFADSPYDVVASYHHESKMISWIFRHRSTFAV